MMKPSILKAMMAGVVLVGTVVLATPDLFFLGAGGSHYTARSPDTVINDYAQVTKPVAVGTSRVAVQSTRGFAAGDLVLVIQMQGLGAAQEGSDPFFIELSDGPVGTWELARVERVGAGTEPALELRAPLVHAYAESVTQVVRVPEYEDVVIPRGTGLVAREWDGSTGGVLAFMARGTVTNHGVIDASGKGFRGGVFVPGGFGPTDCSAQEWSPTGLGPWQGEGVDPLRYGDFDLGWIPPANGGGGGGCRLSGGGGG
ncbi:MAG: adhesin, partial [Myxococcaceae bacterium]